MIAARALVAAALLCSACDPDDKLQGASCDAAAVSVNVGVDTTLGVSSTTNGYLVPLVIHATMPCLEGTARALVIASAGQFSSAGAPVPDASTASAAPADAATEGGSDGAAGLAASAAPSPSASSAPAGATTTVTLTPAGDSDYVGFTTLAVSGAQLDARIQVTLGDAASCGTLTVSVGADASVGIGDSGTCVP